MSVHGAGLLRSEGRWLGRAAALGCVGMLLALLWGSAAAQGGARPLGAADIEGLLRDGVTPARLATLVGQRGVSFEMSPALDRQLRAAGADDRLIAAIERAALAAERRRLDEEKARLQADREAAEREQQAAAAGMVSVPGGPFFMGCNERVDTECYDDEKPGRTVDVPAFKIDKTEVTVAQYARCVDAGACSAPGSGSRTSQAGPMASSIRRLPVPSPRAHRPTEPST